MPSMPQKGIMTGLLVLIIVLTSCDYNRRTTGWQYGDDMAHSAAYESYTPNSNFKDGKTMQPPMLPWQKRNWSCSKPDSPIPRSMPPLPQL